MEYVDKKDTISQQMTCNKCDQILDRFPCPSLNHDFKLEGPYISEPYTGGCGCHSDLHEDHGVYYIGVCSICKLNTPPIVVQDYFTYTLRRNPNGQPSGFTKIMEQIFKDKNPGKEVPVVDLYSIAQDKLKKMILDEV